MKRKLLVVLLMGVLVATSITAKAESYTGTLYQGSDYQVSCSCTTSGYSGTITYSGTKQGWKVKVTADTYTNLMVEPGEYQEVLTGETFTTAYVDNTVKGTWYTNGLYMMTQAELTYMEKSDFYVGVAGVVYLKAQ